MLKHLSRSKKKKMNFQDMNSSFLCLKDFYNSIPDYSDINHLPEKQFYQKLECLKKKQHELTKFKRRKHCEHNHNCHDFKPSQFEETTSSTSVTDFEKSFNYKEKLTSIKHLEEPQHHARPKSSSSRKKPTDSRLSNVEDDYELFNNLKNCRSKSISPLRTSNYDTKVFNTKIDDEKFYSDITNDRLAALDHQKIKRPSTSKEIPITSRIPLYDMVVKDQEHKNQLAKLDSQIKLQSQMKPFQFSESRNSTRRCMSRSLSTPHLNFSDNDSEVDSIDCTQFKATPFPKNLFCNYFQYKIWENNYFRALNKRLRSEELLKASKLPPSMAKREEDTKLNEILQEESRATSVQNQLPEIPKKKRKSRKKQAKRSKSSAGSVKRPDYSVYSKSSLLDKLKIKEAKEKKSTKLQETSTENKKENSSDQIKFSPTPLYPVNRPNLAAVLRYEWSREKLNRMKETNDQIMRDKFRKPNWGVNKTYAFQQLNQETTNEEEISMRLATRLAEQKLRMAEHEMNMELIKQRVMQKPLLLEGPQKLDYLPSSHHCDYRIEQPKSHNINYLSKLHTRPSRLKRPGSSKMSSCSTDSKTSSMNSKST